MVSVIGGTASRESALTALKEVNGDKSALWRVVSQRYPSPLATSTHLFATSPAATPDTSTPLSFGGAALLVLRACLPLLATCSMLRSRALSIVYKLLPLIAEENMPTVVHSDEQDNMRALTVTRVGIALRCLLDTFGDELSIEPKEFEEDSMLPFNLIHFLLASSRVLPIEWLASPLTSIDPLVVVGDVVEDALEQVAFSTTIRRTHPSMTSDCALALSVLRPDRSQDLSLALKVLKDAKPIVAMEARFFTNGGVWMEEWLSCIDASLKNVLRYVKLKQEAEALASNAVLMWVIAGTSGAVIGDLDSTWKERLRSAELVVQNILQFQQPTEDLDEGVESCSSCLRNAVLEALAAVLTHGQLKCTAMEDLQVSGFEVTDKWEVQTPAQLTQLLNSPIFSSILLVAVDELSKIDTNLEVISTETTSIITYFLEHVTDVQEVSWPCGIQLHLSLSLSQADPFRHRDKISNIDTTGEFQLRSLFEDSSQVRLSAAEWLVRQVDQLPEVCLTESCRISKDFMSCLKSHGEVEETRLMGQFSDGDIQQLIHLVLDNGVAHTTRVTACRHLSHLVGSSIDTHESTIKEEDVVSLTTAALSLATPITSVHRSSVQDACDKSGAALDLLLSLLWAFSGRVRPMIMTTLFVSVLPWLFAAGCPHQPLRLCAGKASLVLWRVMFDPCDFIDTLDATSNNQHVYPIGVLIAFPCPPLDCLSLNMKHVISILLNKDKTIDERKSSCPSDSWTCEVLKFVQSELRTKTGELDEREESIKREWCPVQSAASVKYKMTRASSHAELKSWVIVTASRAAVDPLFLTAFASHNSDSDAISWEKALHPLLSNIPNTARDYRLLQCALPLLLGMVPCLSDQDRTSLTSKILDVMVPLITGNQDQRTDEEVSPAFDFSSSTTRQDNHTHDGTKSSVRLLVLRLLNTLATCSSDLALRIITDPRLSSRVLDIISSPLSDCELTKRETLLLISSAVRSLQTSNSMNDENSALRVLIPELLGRCMSCLSLPRLPDSWTHKGIVRAAIEAVSCFMTLCSCMDAANGGDMQTRAVIVANHGGGRGRGLVHWCRRLCCDREAPVRTFSFTVLAILVKLDKVWSSSSQEEGWTLTEACMTATRVVSDQSEVPLVRAACMDVVSARLRHGDELSMKCAMTCMRALASCDESSSNTPCLAGASARLIALLSSMDSLEKWEEIIWNSGMVAKLTMWINPDTFGEGSDGYVVSGVAAQALRLSLACIDTLDFRAKVLKSTNVLENMFQVLRFQGPLNTPSLIDHFAEVALLLHDLLSMQSNCSSTCALLALHKEVAPIITMNLARVLAIEDDGSSEEALNRAHRASLRLTLAILSMPAWSGAVASHTSAAIMLWQALAETRLVVLPVLSEKAQSHRSVQDSLLCHLALTAIVDLTPGCIEKDSMEYEEMATQLCSEVEAIHDTVLKQTSLKHRTGQQGKVVVLGHKFQPRLLLLRSLCVHTQLSKEVCLQLNSLVDRVWPLDTVKSECTSPSCLDLLIGVIGGMSRDEETAKILCNSQRLVSKTLSETRSTFSTSSHASHRSLVSRTTDDSKQHAGSNHSVNSVKKSLLFMISPMTKGNTAVEETTMHEYVTAGMTWRYLVQCSEGRMLLSNSLHPLITLMHHLLKAPRQRRREASIRLVSLLQVLVSASLHDQDFQHTLFKANDFAEFLLALAEKCSTQEEVNETIQFNTRAQFTDRSFCEFDTTENVCSLEVKELLSLLIRNLAGLRGNKAKLCSTYGILEFLLLSITSHETKLVASASCALWAILHDSERAKSALRSLNAEEVAVKALNNMNSKLLHKTSSMSGKSANQEEVDLPSVQRSLRHLNMVLELISQ